MFYTPELTYTFDDIAILPSVRSSVATRRGVDISTLLLDVELPLPVLSASMSVFDLDKTGRIYLDFARHMYHAGGLHIFSRRSSFVDRTEVTSELNEEGVEYGIAVSMQEFAIYRSMLEKLHCFVSVDIANGAILPDVGHWDGLYPLIIGNFGHPRASAERSNDKNVIHKYGIGGGAACTTRLVTGAGVPQAWLVANASEENTTVCKISDGGVKSVGDICKALALGADAVMCGAMLAGARETPGAPVKLDGKWYKPYNGEAAASAKTEGDYIEGLDGYVPYEDKSIYDLLDSIGDGLRSSMSYVGAVDLLSYRRLATFVRVTPSAKLENGGRIYAAGQNR